MERLRVFLCVGLLSLVLVVAPAVRLAPVAAVGSLTFTTLDFPGATGTFARGINNAGQIVGHFSDSSNKNHAFLFSGGAFTALTINIPGVTVTQSSAHGINNLGQIVGGYVDANGANHGFLLSGGTATTIDVPGANRTTALGINDSGQIVGSFCSPCFFGIAAGFLLSGGSFQTISAPGALPGATDAQGINNSSKIVGAFETGDGRVHGYLLSSGNFTTIDVPGAPGTEPLGLNNNGQIVGGYVDVTNALHGFLFSGGTFMTIDAPGAVTPPNTSTSAARAINDSGQIVGFFQDSAGKNHGYLASPSITVAIAIKPGSTPPVPINPGSQGLIPVAILSSATFNAPTVVNKSSVKFGRTGNESSLGFCDASGQDVNGDGLLDLVCHFHTLETGFQTGDTVGVLKGQTVTGTPFQGTESIRIVH